MKLYAATDSIFILNPLDLKPTRVLAFWEAFPGTRHGEESINLLTVDQGLKLVCHQ
jgi:hypothetical protein